MGRVLDTSEIANVADPRQRLALAGANQLAHHGFEILAAGISPQHITEAAGRSRRVFYDHFDTKGEFLRSVTELYLDTSMHNVVTQASRSEIAGLLQLTEGDLFDSMQRLAALGFEGVLASDADLIQIIALVMGHRDPDIRAQVTRYYAEVDAATEVISETILDHWGLQFRPPWTAEGFAGVVHALGEGFYLRNRVDPGVANLEIFELTLLSLLPTVAMRVGGEDVDVREHLERFAEDVSSSWRTNTAAVPVDNAYERVIRAFRAELTNRGLDKVTINAVSKRSQLSPALISSNFGGIPALLRASVFDSLPSLREEAQFDLTSVSLTTDDVLLRHLTRVGSWMADHPELVRAVIALGAIGAPDTAERQLTKDVVHELSAPAAIILASGVHRGDLRADLGLDLDDVASMATELMLCRSGSFGEHDVTRTIAFISFTVLEGCRVTSPH